MLWVKALHLISMVTWFAAIFYLPRLFVYHAMASDDISNERFKIMERKLYRGIMTPSMIATLVFGFWLSSFNAHYYFSSGWFLTKLALIFCLVLYHIQCGRILKQFASDQNTRGHVYFRWFNELPVFILLAVVILAVVRPF